MSEHHRTPSQGIVRALCWGTARAVTPALPSCCVCPGQWQRVSSTSFAKHIQAVKELRPQGELGWPNGELSGPGQRTFGLGQLCRTSAFARACRTPASLQQAAATQLCLSSCTCGHPQTPGAQLHFSNSARSGICSMWDLQPPAQERCRDLVALREKMKSTYPKVLQTAHPLFPGPPHSLTLAVFSKAGPVPVFQL